MVVVTVPTETLDMESVVWPSAVPTVVMTSVLLYCVVTVDPCNVYVVLSSIGLVIMYVLKTGKLVTVDVATVVSNVVKGSVKVCVMLFHVVGVALKKEAVW